MSDIANRLYPNEAPAPAAAPADEAFTLTPAQVLSPTPEQPQQELEAQEQERMADRLYSADSTYAGVELEAAFQDALELSDEQVSEASGAWRQIFQDLGTSPKEAQDLLGVARHVINEPPDGATRQTWARDAQRQLREKYGADAGAALQLAQKLIARDPRLKASLESTGLGDHPSIVLKACELARRQANRGRL